jgi:hypothetical protein
MSMHLIGVYFMGRASHMYASHSRESRWCVSYTSYKRVFVQMVVVKLIGAVGKKNGFGAWGQNSVYPTLLWVRTTFSLAPSPQIHLKSTNFRSRSTSSYRLAVPFPNSRFLNKYAHNHRIGSRYIGSVDQIQRAYQSQTCLRKAITCRLPKSVIVFEEFGSHHLPYCSNQSESRHQ